LRCFVVGDGHVKSGSSDSGLPPLRKPACRDVVRVHDSNDSLSAVD
jgi:hypothetical protein